MVVVVVIMVVVMVIMAVGDLTKSNKNIIPQGGTVRVVLTSIFRETSTTRCLDSAAPLLQIRSQFLRWFALYKVHTLETCRSKFYLFWL